MIRNIFMDVPSVRRYSWTNMKTKAEIANLIDIELQEKFVGYPDTPETKVHVIAFTEQLVREYTNDIPLCDNSRLKVICNLTGGKGINRRGYLIDIVVPPEHILYDGPYRLEGVYNE